MIRQLEHRQVARFAELATRIPSQARAPERKLAVDLFDVKERAPVWHGRATTTITQGDRNDPVEFLNEVVAEVFSEYPPS